MENSTYGLGDKAKDKVSLFQGIITEIHMTLDGEKIVLVDLDGIVKVFPMIRIEVLEVNPLGLVDNETEDTDEDKDVESTDEVT